MWVNEVIAAIVGLSGGMVVATALAAFIIGLGIIPRYAGVTHTGHSAPLEDASDPGDLSGKYFIPVSVPCAFRTLGTGCHRHILRHIPGKLDHCFG